MFDHLPLHIHEAIFSRVSYLDLFETARVSQGWWALTMASFERVLHMNDDFLSDQVDFCNEIMPKGQPWEFWMLMEFTKSKTLCLNSCDFQQLINGPLISYYEDKEINVKHLTLIGDFCGGNSKLPPNLDQLFPYIKSLELEGVEFDLGSTIVLPPKLEVVKLSQVNIPSSLTSILSDLNELKALSLTGIRDNVYFNGRDCRNLSSLSIDASYMLANYPIKANDNLRRILEGIKGLKNVSLRGASINKDWLKMFPSNVVKLELKDPYLSPNLVEMFGDNVLYERVTLFYIFEDWKSVDEFRTWEMTWINVWREVGEYGRQDDACYRIRYVCKPTINVEEIRTVIQNSALNDAILQNNEGLCLTKLVCVADNFPSAVPRTVRNLSIDSFNQTGETLVFEDPSALQTLNLDQLHSFVINLDDLPKMINLRELHVSKCNSRHLAPILVSCPSLAELTLDHPEFRVFNDIMPDIQSVSLNCLTILSGSDTFEDILKHLPSLDTLFLVDYSETAVLESDVNAISRLHYFKAAVKRKENVAAHLSKLDFPYMVFATCGPYDCFAASKGLELTNDLSEIASQNNQINTEGSFIFHIYSKKEHLSIVSTKNISTRFLRFRFLLVNTVHDFISKKRKI